MKDNLVIIGAGGHSKVVLDAALPLTEHYDFFVYDEFSDSQDILGVKITNTLESASTNNSFFHVAIGDNNVREKLYKFALDLGYQPFTIRHSNSSISKFSEVRDSAFIAASSVIGPMSYIDVGCIINHGAVVDHDCRVGKFCHIAPNVTLGGNVFIGDNCLIGAGSTILPGVRIGSNCTIGAGAVVIKDILDMQTVKGVPAV